MEKDSDGIKQKEAYFTLSLHGGVDNWMEQIEEQGFYAEKPYLSTLADHLARAQRIKFNAVITRDDLEEIKERIFRKVLNHVVELN